MTNLMNALLGWNVLLVAGLWVAVLFYYGVVLFRKPKKAYAITSFESRPSTSDPEVVVVGSGVLGSALASALARDGRRVTVIERDLKEPDRIIGELLQPGGCRALETLKLKDCLSGFDAHPIHGYMIHEMSQGATVHIPYPEGKGGRGQEQGRAFHHGRFVMALRKAAQAEKNVTYIEGTVRKLIEKDGKVIGVEYKDKATEETKSVHAPLTVVADGCFSKFRKTLVKESPVVKSHFAGLLLENCPQAKPNHAELVLAEPIPILVYQISSRDTRMLVDVRGGLPRDMKEYFREQVYPHLPEHLQVPFWEAVESQRIRSMPNSFLPCVPIEKPGVMCLGDALNMRHPLTGGGMSVALNDVVLLRDTLRELPDLSDYAAVARHTRALYWQRKSQHAFVVNVLSMALYELFAAQDADLKKMKEACFAYFQFGGECVSGPVGLLSVLTPKPHVLIGHFFAVAVYAVLMTLRGKKGESWVECIRSAAAILTKACAIILPLIWSEIKTFLTF